MARNFRGVQYLQKAIFKDFVIEFSRMDLPELLHPQYRLGSAANCMCTMGQILLEPAKKVVKNQQAIDQSYMNLAEIEKWRKSHIITQLG